MSANTSIEWTDHTFNPWWGCAKVSPGCVHCYAETWAKRTGHGGTWGAKGERRKFGEKHWAEPLKWNRQAEAEGRSQRVFCASMADVFEDHPALPEERERLWRLIEDTPHLDWQLLTKRPENIARMIPPSWLEEPRENVWYGTSVATQEWADKRIPVLLHTPAAVRFISAEPLLGPVDLGYREPCDHPRRPCLDIGCWRALDWVICGGESGPGARPMHPDWARSLRDQCVAAGVPYFFKQWGAWSPEAPERGPRKAVVWSDGQGPFDQPYPHPPENVRPALMWQVGKKAAGRELGGRAWDEMPERRLVSEVRNG